MAQENENILEQSETSGTSKGSSSKILVIGLPLFIVQLVAVYFITANILLPKIQSHYAVPTEEHAQSGDSSASESEGVEFGKFIYVVDDLIINPAGTDGKRLLLASIGFDIATEQNKKELEEKEVLVKDAIISVMGSKDMTQLSNALYRDSLKIQISDQIKQLMPDVKINNIYFSKYILQ
ncbi:Flagellar basal body-associated protein FliL [Melioribacter roseus P3M-2]|uniref:Flagellar protein FliL n=1 Tax=Melioribacter roseus (strain DSM 23840 / JCM 17771 / VKM B-2668 / P3M-2) TaxID=1191523 RepID=I6ZTK6_MELRP|nr:flagellar basal body-associated FliL family protein [Melioribacter roseus]AFN75369.1 Flagellar basal body-associated protein FliL [Melioribacter roseus P3M-2]